MIKPLDQRGRAVFAAVLAAGVAAGAWCLHTLLTRPFDGWRGFLLLATLTLASGLVSLKLPGFNSLLSLSDTCVFLTVLLFGPAPAALLAGVDGMISTYRNTRRTLSIAASGAVMVFSVAVAGLSYEWVLGQLWQKADGPPPVPVLIIPLMLLGLMHWIVNSSIVAVLTSAARRLPAYSLWREHYFWTVLNFVAGASVAGIVAQLIQRDQELTAFLFALPLVLGTFLTYRVFVSRVEAEREKLLQANALQLKTVEALAAAIDARAQTTAGHPRRAQAYAVGLAEKAGVDENTLEAIRSAVLLHEIGKLAIPDYILNKPAALTSAELSKLRTYPRIGGEILSRVNFPYPIVPIVQSHRERWDGGGYPAGLRGESIPLGARIVALADGVDMMLCGNSQVAALSVEQMLLQLRQESGRRYEPALVELFVTHAEELLDRGRQAGATDVGATEEIARAQREHAHSLYAEQAPVAALDTISAARREDQLLVDTARELSSILEVSRAVAYVAERIIELVPHRTLVIYVASETHDELRAYHVEGQDADLFRGRALRPGQGLTGRAVLQRSLIVSESAAEEYQALAVEMRTPNLPMLVLPMLVEDGCVGAISLIGLESQEFSDESTRITERIAALSAHAIHKTRTYERAVASSMTDGLTGLFNARYLFSRLDDLLQTAKRASIPVGLAVIDLDRFKPINDRYGHEVGDEVLRRMGERLKNYFRSGDIICRWGGDEFVVVMPGSDAPLSRSRLLELQADIERWSIPNEQGLPLSVGISAGWASFPSDGTGLQELLTVADQRMYEDKRRRHAAQLASQR